MIKLYFTGGATIIASLSESKKGVTIRTSSGEVTYECALRRQSESNVPAMLFGVMAGVAEAQQCPTYQNWVKYLSYMGDNSPNKDDYNDFKKDARAWEKVSGGITADEILTVLSENFNI